MKRKSIYLAVASLLMSSAVLADHNVLLDEVAVRGTKTNEILPTYPSVTSTVDAKDIAETINAVDTPDVLKYLPNIFVRKRDSADYNGAPIASRIWGASYSAKSIVNVDGMPITNQLFNDNNYGSPKWFMTSPEEIRIAEVMYGPYSAAYSGNSMGAVVNIATKMPTEFTAVVSTTAALQDFKKFGTNDNYFTGQAHALIGDKSENLSWRISLNHQDAETQPRQFVTDTANTVNPITSGYAYTKKDNSNGGFYQGATSLIHGVSDGVNLKLEYQVDPEFKVGISSGIFVADTKSRAESYTNTYNTNTSANTFKLYTNGSGAFTNIAIPAYATISSGYQQSTNPSVYNLEQQHLMNSIFVKSNPNRDLTWEFIASNFYYDKHLQRWSSSLNADGSMNNSANGMIQDFGGTGWTNIDLRGNYKPRELPSHVISAGVHYDINKLNLRQAYFLNSDWVNASSGSGSDFSISKGVTETKSAWLQDAWKIADRFKVTTGLRAERWQAHDGYNYSYVLTPGTNTATAAGVWGGISQVQPSTQFSALSPKLSVSWDTSTSWLMTASYGKATRFPTPSELYAILKCSSTSQPVSGSCGSGSSSAPYKIPDPTALKPENVDSVEISFEQFGDSSTSRVTFFGEEVKNALATALTVLDSSYPNAYYSPWQNINKARNYGVEFYGKRENVFVHGLDLTGNLTLLKSNIIDAGGKIDIQGRSLVGHSLPYTSPIRLTIVGLYRPDAHWAYSLSGRYQKAGSSSIDNIDPNPNTYGGFSSYFVVDAKVSYKFDKNWRASFGVDNLLNRDYFIYHPFPQRTFIANLKYTN